MITKVEDMGEYLRVHEDGEIPHIHDIPYEHIASMSELLGYTDAADVVAAVIRREEEPDPDPVTSENMWTSLILMTKEVESAREKEYVKAQEEGRQNDPRSPHLRSAMKARSKLMEMSGGECPTGETIRDKAQRQARSILNIPCPKKSAPVVRGVSLTCEPESLCPESDRFDLSAEDRERIREKLAPNLEKIRGLKAKYCHYLADPSSDDPLEPEYGIEPEPEPEPDPAPVELNIQNILLRPEGSLVFSGIPCNPPGEG